MSKGIVTPSFQIGTLRELPLGDSEFPFGVLIKNETGDDVQLEVVLASCEEPITTTFYNGWNNEHVTKVINNTNKNIKYGW